MIKRIFLIAAAVLAFGTTDIWAQRVMVTWVGTGTAGSTGDNNLATQANINSPKDICLDAQRNVYINGGGVIRKISAKTGIITTYAGGGSSTADGVPATSANINAGCFCLDPSGNLYVVSGHRIRKVDVATGLITTIAGTTTPGFSGDGGPAAMAQFSSPYGICSDASGNLFIADKSNSRIRRIDAATGVIETIAGGVNGYSGDGGPAIGAGLYNMSVICVSNTGDIFFSDQGGTRIRMISAATGLISHIAGVGSGAYGTGNGGPAAAACVGNVNGICVDNDVDVYIDDDSCACRKIDMTTGIIDIVAGDMHSEGYNGDEGNALLKFFNWPKGVCVDAEKNLYVADMTNNRIRKAIQLTSAPSFAYGRGQSMLLCSGSAMPLTKELSVVDKDAGETETWSVILPPAGGTLSGFPASAASVGVSGVVRPAGAVYTPPSTYNADDSFQVQVSDGMYADTLTIHVRLPNTGVITGPSIVCTGATVSLSGSMPGGVWSSVGGIATVSASGDVTGVAPGIANVRYTLTDAICGFIYTSKNVTVDLMPDPGTIYGSETICVGTTYLWTNSGAEGVWSSDNGNVVYASGGFFTGATAGVDSIRYTVTTTCGTASATRAVVVEPLPDAGSILASADELCIGSTLVVASTVSGGDWSMSNVNASINTAGVITGLIPGTSTVNYSVTNACGTDVASKDLIVEDCGVTSVTSVQQQQFTVYPNPAASMLTLEWGSVNDQVSITITDVTGKIVVASTAPVGSSTMKTDVSLLSEGIYLLTAKGGTVNEMRKIVISRN